MFFLFIRVNVICFYTQLLQLYYKMIALNKSSTIMQLVAMLLVLLNCSIKNIKKSTQKHNCNTLLVPLSIHLDINVLLYMHINRQKPKGKGGWYGDQTLSKTGAHMHTQHAPTPPPFQTPHFLPRWLRERGVGGTITRSLSQSLYEGVGRKYYLGVGCRCSIFDSSSALINFSLSQAAMAN